MSYYLTALGATLGTEQIKALTDIDPLDIRALPVDRRVELALQHAENEGRKKEAFWTAVQVALPVLAFFGISRWGK